MLNPTGVNPTNAVNPTTSTPTEMVLLQEKKNRPRGVWTVQEDTIIMELAKSMPKDTRDRIQWAKVVWPEFLKRVPATTAVNHNNIKDRYGVFTSNPAQYQSGPLVAVEAMVPVVRTTPTAVNPTVRVTPTGVNPRTVVNTRRVNPTTRVNLRVTNTRSTQRTPADAARPSAAAQQRPNKRKHYDSDYEFDSESESETEVDDKWDENAESPEEESETEDEDSEEEQDDAGSHNLYDTDSGEQEEAKDDSSTDDGSAGKSDPFDMIEVDKDEDGQGNWLDEERSQDM